VLALTLSRKANGRVDGFIVEFPTAGGHNAPHRGKRQLNDRGEPIYGKRDVVDLKKLQAIGLPFWLAGGYGAPDKSEKRSTLARPVCRSARHSRSVPSRASARTVAVHCCSRS